jgi:hypothetical protein
VLQGFCGHWPVRSPPWPATHSRVNVGKQAVEGCGPVDVEPRRHAARPRLVGIDGADELGQGNAPGEVACVYETDASESGDAESNAPHRPSMPFSSDTRSVASAQMRADEHLHACGSGILDRGEAVGDGFLEREPPEDHLVSGQDAVREQPDCGGEVLVPDV